MKKALVSALLCLAASACGPEVPRPAETPASKQETTVDDGSKDIVVDHRAWSISLVRDEGWTVKTNDKDKVVFVKPEALDPAMLVLVVTTVPWDDNNLDSAFGSVALVAAGSIGKVVTSNPTRVSGFIGSEAVVEKLDEGLIIVQHAVAHNHTAIVAICGGPLAERSWVVGSCQLALSGLAVKP